MTSGDDPRRPVTVATCAHRGEAEIVRARLAGAGIPSMVAADDEGGLSPGFYTDFTVRVLVASEDLERARVEIGESGAD
jgi:hypothetical protein